MLLFAGQVFAEMPLVRDPVQSIIISKKKVGHFDQPIPFDQPDVYLDTSNAVIIIDGVVNMDDMSILINLLLTE